MYEYIRKNLEIIENKILTSAQKSGRHRDDIILVVVAKTFSDEMAKNDRELKEFLFPNMYRHYKLNRMTSKAQRVVTDLFELFLSEPGTLPTEWQVGTDGPNTEHTARQVADYIAGMTDRYALDEHKRLFDLQARTSEFTLG